MLTVDSRGGPGVVIRIGGAEAARVACDGGVVLTPGSPGIPALPWDLQVTRQSDGQRLFAKTVNVLPQWLLILGVNITLSESPIAGPAGPQCASP